MTTCTDCRFTPGGVKQCTACADTDAILVGRTFGKLERTAQAARRKMGLARAQGWIAVTVREVRRGGERFYAVRGVPLRARLQALNGVKEGRVNLPRVVNEKRRRGQDYRHGGI